MPLTLDPAAGHEHRRILVTGARGYVGSRLVPLLLSQGHEVVATSSSQPDRGRFAWGRDVEWRVMDATDGEQVRTAVDGVDAVCYLVHSLASKDFGRLDRIAAHAMREAVDDTGVKRLVYLSGLVPDGPRSELSEHLSSRLEVEEILLESRASTLAMRAGVVVGAGSTSFEIIRQIASLMLVQPLPTWIDHQIQPIAATDVLAMLAHALEHDEPVGTVDVGGPDIVSYPDLLLEFSQAAHLLRVQLPVPLVPTAIVAKAAPLLLGAPGSTVSSLVESMHHDMVCDPERHWTMAGAATSLSLAIGESLRTEGDDDDPYVAQRLLPSDAGWTDRRWLVERITGRTLPLPAVVRASSATALNPLSRLRAALQ